jgi:hypothetical protein
MVLVSDDRQASGAAYKAQADLLQANLGVPARTGRAPERGGNHSGVQTGVKQLNNGAVR